MSETAATIEAKLEKEIQLRRFFQRLLTEARHAEAEEAHFRIVENSLLAVLKKGATDSQQHKLSRDWFDPIGVWLLERSSVLAELLEYGSAGVHFESVVSMRAESASKAFAACDGLECVCAVQVGDEVLSFRMRKLSHLNRQSSIELSRIRAHSLAHAVSVYGGLDSSDRPFHSLIAHSSGVVVVASPDVSHLRHAVGAFLSFTNAYHISDLSGLGAALAARSRQSLPLILVAGIRADDAVEALFKLREYGFDLRSPELRGVVCQGFVKRVCDRCGRETPPDPKLVDMLPDSLKPKAEFTYLVGRGCDACGHSGYRGLASVRSVLLVDDGLRDRISSGQNPNLYAHESEQAEIASYAYSHGTKPLLEIGMLKVLRGEISLESLFELSRVVSPAFSKVILERKNSSSTSGALKRAPHLAQHGVQFAPGGGATARHAAGKDGELILIVEDDPDQQKILEMVFRGAGYKTSTAKDGLEALEALKSDTPNLIITDLMMPNMDGKELVSRIKLQEKFRNIPVLVLTVVADSEREFDLLDLGVDDYCEKTIQRKVLLKRVQNLLKRSERT